MPVDSTLANPTAEPNTWKATVLDPWVADVSGTIASLESGGASYTGATWEIWVDDQVGATDDLKMQAAFDAAVAALRAPPTGGEPRSSATIRFGARTYAFTSDGCMMAAASLSTASWGIKYKGMGNFQTLITYDPTAEAYMCRNTDDWNGIYFEGIEFVGLDATNACFYRGDRQIVSGSNQIHSWLNCSWSGNWKYGWRISGVNNNDTWKLDGCHFWGDWDTVFWSDADGTDPTGSDQQVWFTFLHCGLHLDTAVYVFRFTRGGNVSFISGSWLMTQTETMVWLKLEGNTHSGGATRLTVSGIRGELRDSNQLIECDWPDGEVSFQDCDFGVLSDTITSAQNAIFRPLAGSSMPIITWMRCKLQGKHTYEHSTVTAVAQRIMYDSCQLMNHDDAADFIIFQALSGGGNDGGRPVVHFRNCRGTAGGTIVDTDLNWYWNVAGETQRKVVSFKDVFGTNPSQFGSGVSTSVTRTLPLNAVIVEARIAWDGAIGAAGGHITFRDGTPTTILDATTLNAAGAAVTAHGYRFKCDTDTKRAITLIADANCTGIQYGDDFEAWIEYIG
jgi:hypothetical protein